MKYATPNGVVCVMLGVRGTNMQSHEIDVVVTLLVKRMLHRRGYISVEGVDANMQFLRDRCCSDLENSSDVT